MADRDKRVRDIAYRLWDQEGRPAGRAEEHRRQAITLAEAEEAIARHADPPPPPEAEPQPPFPPAGLETRSAEAPATPALPISTELATGETTDRQNVAPPKQTAEAERKSRRGGMRRP